MPRSSFQFTATIATEAQYRLWVSSIRAAFEGAGLVRTADTGQIDPTTVALPATGGTGGYDVFRFNDAAQSTHPLLLRVDYHRGSSSQPQIRVYVGTASNGAGTITSLLYDIGLLNTNSATGLVEDFYALHEDGLVVFAGAITNATAAQSFAFGVERLRSPSGAIDVSGDAGVCITSTLGTSFSMRCVDHSTPATYDQRTNTDPLPVLAPGRSTSPIPLNLAWEGVTYALPIFGFLGKPRGALRHIVMCSAADAGQGAQFTVEDTSYRIAKVFVAATSTPRVTNSATSSDNPASFGLRY